jgi:hypothetical protein
MIMTSSSEESDDEEGDKMQVDGILTESETESKTTSKDKADILKGETRFGSPVTTNAETTLQSPSGK